jgi:hypothetical protein
MLTDDFPAGSADRMTDVRLVSEDMGTPEGILIIDDLFSW